MTAMRGATASAAEHSQPHPSAEIRPLGESQAAAIGRLMFNAYLGTVDDHGETEAWHQAEAKSTFERQFGEMVWQASTTAIIGDQLVGATVVTFEHGRILLAFALVEPRWQGKGIGTSLIAASARELSDLGHSEWTLAVSEGNPAVRLYQRLGFSVAPNLVWEPPSDTTQ